MNTFTQQYVMAVFAVKYRLGLIDPKWAPNLYAIMGSILKEIDGVKPVKICGYQDHVHALYCTAVKISDSEVMRRLKSESSRWVNEQRLTVGKFGWQRGGARISCSPTSLNRLIHYIESQWEHHRRVSFREEYDRWLRSLGVTPEKYDMPEDLM